jgi:hypothetical protein
MTVAELTKRAAGKGLGERVRPGVQRDAPATRLFRNARYYFAAVLALVVYGFWHTYFAVMGSARATIHVHAALSLLWVVMLVAQASLVRNGRLRRHRRLGQASYLLFPAIVALGLVVSHEAAVRAGDELSDFSIQALTLPLYGLFQFVLAYGCAIVYRRTPALHARWMIATAIPLLSAAVLRIIPLWAPASMTAAASEETRFAIAAHTHIVVSELILLALIANDVRLGRIRAPFPVLLFVVALWHPLFELAPDMGWWRAIAQLVHG